MPACFRAYGWHALLLGALLPGCSFVSNTIKSELSAYSEPTDGELAHIRLIGSRNVKVYPNSPCASYTVPGSGYPAGPQMGGQRKRDLGMPKPPSMPKHFVEIAARAGQPIAAGFAFYTESYMPGIAGTGMQGTRSTASCYAAGTFVPQAGQNYEATAIWNRGGCAIQVMRLVQDANGPVRRVPVSSLPAESCPAPPADA